MSGKIRNLVLLGFFLRFLVAFWNGFFGPSFGADLDALNFHLEAVNFSLNPEFSDFRIGWVYTYLLGGLYYLTTDSLFLGSLLSCIVWLGSAILMLGIMKLLQFKLWNQASIIRIYILLPSSILYTSVTLRESYQLFFVNLAIFSALKINLRKSYIHWILLAIACVGMGVLHGALFVCGVFIVISTLLMIVVSGSKNFPLNKVLVMTPIILLISYYGFTLFTDVSYGLEDGLGAGIEAYQEGLLGVDARTHYKEGINLDGIGGILTFVPMSLFQYLFEPFPWKISTVLDLELFIENLIRFYLLGKVYFSFRYHSGSRIVGFFIFGTYILIELIWSIGTVNWGTAVRHHIPAMGLLLIAAFSGNYERLKSSE